MAEYPDDYWVKAAQYTKNVYRDVYPAVDPSRPELSMAGKVIIVTGASRGIGARVSPGPGPPYRHPQTNQTHSRPPGHRSSLCQSRRQSHRARGAGPEQAGGRGTRDSRHQPGRPVPVRADRHRRPRVGAAAVRKGQGAVRLRRRLRQQRRTLPGLGNHS